MCFNVFQVDVVSLGRQLITWPLFVCYKLSQLLMGRALFNSKGSSNQELEELITMASDQLTALTYYVYFNLY